MLKNLLEYLNLLQIPYELVNHEQQINLPLPILDEPNLNPCHNYLLEYRRLVFYSYLPTKQNKTLIIGPLTSHRIYGMETFEMFFCYNSATRYNHLRDLLGNAPLTGLKAFEKLLTKVIADYHFPNSDLIIRHIQKSPTRTYNFTQLPNEEIQKEIITAIRFGDLDKISSILHNPALVSNSTIVAKNPPKKDLQYFYFSTLSRISDIAVATGVSQEIIAELTNRYVKLWQDPSLDAFKIGNLLVKAMLDIAKECRNTIYFQSKDPLPNKVLKYVSNHVHEKITRQRLAAVLNLSPSYLSHCFKKKTGMTITYFVSLFKINQAKLLLATTDLSVLDISAQLAFTHVTYFNHLFKKVAGCSPSAFRKRVNQTARFAPSNSYLNT